MGARTCLLCGKPLSRIWAGTGEDFCSREHRNQYRLRRGMDRLREANEVASVMRRREVARQIPLERLRSAGPSSPREFATAGYAAPRPAPTMAAAIQSLRPARARLSEGAGSVGPAAASGAAGPRGAGAQAIRVRAPLGPRTSARTTAQVGQAQASKPRLAKAELTSSRLASIVAWRAGAPVTGERLRPAAGPAVNSLETARPVRAVARPVRGRTLMVSMAEGFRIPEVKAPAARTGGPEIPGMRWPGLRAAKIGRAAGPEAARAAAIVSGLPAMRTPAAPGTGSATYFRWPETREIEVHRIDAAAGQRSAVVPFGKEESVAKERR